MAEYFKCIDCRQFYEAKGKNEIAKNGKKLEAYCFYCLKTPQIKKIGHKALWSGATPLWCPGKELGEAK